MYTNSIVSLEKWVLNLVRITGHLMSNMWFKSFLATVGVFFSNYLLADIVIFYIYLIFFIINFILVIINNIHKGFGLLQNIILEIKKFIIYMVLIFLIGLLTKSAFHTTGLTVAVVNWVIFFLSFSEIINIILNLRLTGMPVPIFFDKILLFLHKQASKRVNSLVNDPDTKKDLDDIVGEVTGINKLNKENNDVHKNKGE